MGLLNKAVSGVRDFAKREPFFRFGGIQSMGAHTRPADTRTTEQLMANIDYFAQRNPEVAQFKNELKQMNPEHLGLVSDICELANRREMIPTNIDIRNPKQVGKNIFVKWIEKLPKASKENPEALNFTQEVINHTDSTASKYFLAYAVYLLEHTEAASHLRATKPLVKDIAESALNGGYTMDYSKEKDFVDAVGAFINPASDARKIEMLPEVIKAADEAPIDKVYIDSIPFIQSRTPIEQIRENLKVFPEVAKGLSKQTDEVNITDFLTRNVNLD